MEGEKSCQDGEGDLLFNETPKSFGAGDGEDFRRESSGSEVVSLWEEFEAIPEAISRSFPSRKERVEALGVAESERLR